MLRRPCTGSASGKFMLRGRRNRESRRQNRLRMRLRGPQLMLAKRAFCEALGTAFLLAAVALGRWLWPRSTPA
jgi:hypothetical protein